MQKIKYVLSLMLVLVSSFSLSLEAQAEDAEAETGFAGDHFSLELALDLFKNAASMEAFEKALNSEDKLVNNLDLNEDGDIDYIRVVDHQDGDVHAIVLQVPISENESQDIAVIEIEKTGASSAILQIVGDEAVYGETIIVEPFDLEGEQNGGGPSGEFTFRRVILNVWIWPSVRFVYGPSYRLWVSPFSWRVYPRWWSPWRPRPFSWYHTRVRPFRSPFRVVSTHRVVRAHRVYTPRRRASTTVVRKTTVVRTQRGTVAAKRTTTTRVQGRNGNTVVKRNKTTTGAARSRNGAVVGKKTRTTTQAKTKNGRRLGKKTSKTTKVRKRRKQ